MDTRIIYFLPLSEGSYCPLRASGPDADQMKG
jgi:hypothetical protein